MQVDLHNGSKMVVVLLYAVAISHNMTASLTWDRGTSKARRYYN